VDRPAVFDTEAALTPMPVLLDTPGCHFANRCPEVMPVCHQCRPAPYAAAADHAVICHKYPAEEIS
jgi:ABC-type dipeptide/oligopeptide/nickel transport system ATPase component